MIIYCNETYLNIFVTIKYCTVSGEKCFFSTKFCAFGAVLLFHSDMSLLLAESEQRTLNFII